MREQRVAAPHDDLGSTIAQPDLASIALAADEATDRLGDLHQHHVLVRLPRSLTDRIHQGRLAGVGQGPDGQKAQGFAGGVEPGREGLGSEENRVAVLLEGIPERPLVDVALLAQGFDPGAAEFRSDPLIDRLEVAIRGEEHQSTPLGGEDPLEQLVGPSPEVYLVRAIVARQGGDLDRTLD